MRGEQRERSLCTHNNSLVVLLTSDGKEAATDSQCPLSLPMQSCDTEEHMTPPSEHTAQFSSLGISPEILSVLETMKITIPTPIQHKAIPAGLEGKDMIGIAQTGTGKTLAFGIPLLQKLSKEKGRALIIVPTRELAQQVEDSLKKIAMKLNIGTAVFIGGASMGLQRQMLRRNPRILIATPGRLIDHLEQRTVTLREVTVLVLDEADRMLDMGFAPQIQKILKVVPTDRQTLLFSATMPLAISQIAATHMRLPIRIEVAPAGTAAERVEQHMIVLAKNDKIAILDKLLKDYLSTVLVFVRTKHGAKKVTETLKKMGYSIAEIHSNRSLPQRREALAGFKSGRYRVLIATDIAARGIDVSDIELVVNFDLPDNPEDYVHRIGRTGRAGKAGQAISFVTPDQRNEIHTIERLIRTPIATSEIPPLGGGSHPTHTPRTDRPRPQHRGGGNRRPAFRRHRS